jgi:hypothetical protein
VDHRPGRRDSRTLERIDRARNRLLARGEREVLLRNRARLLLEHDHAFACAQEQPRALRVTEADLEAERRAVERFRASQVRDLDRHLVHTANVDHCEPSSGAVW